MKVRNQLLISFVLLVSLESKGLPLLDVLVHNISKPAKSIKKKTFKLNKLRTEKPLTEKGQLAVVTAPTLTTNSANYINENSALCGGNVISEGSSPVQSRGVVLSENSGPTILTGITVNDIGNGVGAYTVFAELKPSTTYYMKAWATNAETTGYGNEMSFTTASVDTTLPSTFTDPRDGEVYTIKKIGGLVWMTQNLNYKRYASPSDLTSNGVLYQGFYPNAQPTSIYGTPRDSIAPPGWHIAINYDWKYLFENYGATDGNFVGQLYNTQNAAKWLLSPSEGGNGKSGFNASFDHQSSGGTGFYSRSGFERGNFIYYSFTPSVNGTFIREGYEDGTTGARVRLYARCVADDTLKLSKNPVTEGAFKIVDPNPSLVNENGTLNTDLTKLDTTKIVKGAATDGVTKLLFIFRSLTPITFQIDSAKDGTLQLLSDQQGGSSETKVYPDDKGRVIVVYTAPDGFGPNPNSQPSRQISVKLDFGNGLLSSLSLKLISPPVILIHGMWSDPSTWSNNNFDTKLRNSGIKYFSADYSDMASVTFNPDSLESLKARARVQSKIFEAFEYYHSNPNFKVAVTQVDIVAHSLGGLMARSYSQTIDGLDQTNFHQGTIHKLITLATPHNGSPFGIELWNHRDSLVKLPGDSQYHKLSEVMAKLGYPIGSCHRDFGINSAGLAALNQTYPFKTFSIQGTATATFLQNFFINYLCKEVFHKDFATIMASNCLGYGAVANDLIVPQSSQKGYDADNGRGQSFPNTAHLALLGGNSAIIGNQDVENKIIALLFSNNTQDFGTGFPPPSTLSRDCNTATERGMDLNASPVQIPATIHRIANVSQYIKITSPVAGATYNQGAGSSIQLTFEPMGGALPSNGIFMIGDLGWFTVPSTPPYTVSAPIPITTNPGRINILAMALDSSGITLADTASINIPQPYGFTITNLLVSPGSVSLDSLSRTASLFATATFLYSGNSTIINVTSVMST